MILRPYQNAAREMLYEWMQNNSGNVVVCLPTGAGKSICIADVCRDIIVNYTETRVLVLTHVKELIEQNYSKFCILCPDIDAGIFSAGIGRKEFNRRVTFAGIQSIHKHAEAFGAVDLIIVDECHLLHHEDVGIYRKFINQMTTLNPELRVVGYTATEYRLGHGLITDKPAIFDGIIKPASILELISGGYLSRLISKATPTKLKTDGVKKRGGEFIESELQKAVNRSDYNAGIVADVIARSEGRKAWLFFCSGVDHAHAIRDELRRQGVAAETVTGKTPKKERERLLDEYKSGRITALTNANVLTTGFDYPDIDLIALCRPTMSAGLYCLDSKTEILCPDGWKGIKDFCNISEAWSVDTETLKAKKCLVSKVKRKLYENEKMYGVELPSVNIRVSDKHRIIHKTRKSDLIVKNADTLPQEFKIPVASFGEFKGVNLSKDDLYFIGIFLSDGSLNKKNNAIMITQGERHLHIVNRIRQTIKNCGFKYNEIIKKNEITNYGLRRHDMHLFTISKGKPRGRDKHLTGWYRIGNFIDKNIPSCYDDLTRDQLICVLEGINDGDGRKFKHVKYYTPHTMSIAAGTKIYADRIQELCATRGIKCNISKQAKNVFILQININKTFHTITTMSSDSRPTWRELPISKNEIVWCVKTSGGGIITRRHGKVSILGNCQMAGRGLRIKSHIDNCLVLDFAGNVARHGAIVDVRPPDKKKKGEGIAPSKECPKCFEIIAAQRRECPECGYEFPKKEKEFSLSDDDIMGVEKIKEFTVADWKIKKHLSAAGKNVLKITYYAPSGIAVEEFLCIWHQGKAGQIAQSVYSDIFKKSNRFETPPAKVYYKIDGKFKKITKREWKSVDKLAQ